MAFIYYNTLNLEQESTGLKVFKHTHSHICTKQQSISVKSIHSHKKLCK